MTHICTITRQPQTRVEMMCVVYKLYEFTIIALSYHIQADRKNNGIFAAESMVSDACTAILYNAIYILKKQGGMKIHVDVFNITFLQRQND